MFEAEEKGHEAVVEFLLSAFDFPASGSMEGEDVEEEALIEGASSTRSNENC